MEREVIFLERKRVYEDGKWAIELSEKVKAEVSEEMHGKVLELKKGREFPFRISYHNGNGMWAWRGGTWAVPKHIENKVAQISKKVIAEWDQQ